MKRTRREKHVGRPHGRNGSGASTEVEVERLGRRFEVFRRSHEPGTRIPDALRAAALAVLDRGASTGDLFRACRVTSVQLRQWRQHVRRGAREGEQVDPALMSPTEILMPGGVAVTDEEVEYLAATLTPELADAMVVKTLNDQRVRYDVSVTVRPITLNVQKHVVVKDNGERTVVSASTDAYGPPRYSVTWVTLATLAVLIASSRCRSTDWPPCSPRRASSSPQAA